MLRKRAHKRKNPNDDVMIKLNEQKRGGNRLVERDGGRFHPFSSKIVPYPLSYDRKLMDRLALPSLYHIFVFMLNYYAKAMTLTRIYYEVGYISCVRLVSQFVY